MTVTDETQLQMRRDVIEVIYEKHPDYPPARIAMMALLIEEKMAHKMSGVKLND